MIDTTRLATDAAYWDECGAPEWATHYDSHVGAFMEAGLPGPDNIPRPQSEWVDGLPPVGVKCEFRDVGVNFRSEFVKVIPLFYSDQICVLQHWASGNHFSKRLDDIEFCTKEERQRDEIKEDLLGILPFCEYTDSQIDELSKILYAQGYRKPEPKP